jgi:hypothetical protein
MEGPGRFESPIFAGHGRMREHLVFHRPICQSAGQNNMINPSNDLRVPAPHLKLLQDFQMTAFVAMHS